MIEKMDEQKAIIEEKTDEMIESLKRPCPVLKPGLIPLLFSFSQAPTRL